jgi:hypothetical protein
VSASEKLKALSEWKYQDEVFAALPQIVAVVDSGESIKLRSERNGMPPRDCVYVRLTEIDALRNALAALEEALENHVKREWVRRPYPLGDWPNEEALS